MQIHSRYRHRFTEDQQRILEAGEPDSTEWIIVDILNDAAGHIEQLVTDKQWALGQAERTRPIHELLAMMVRVSEQLEMELAQEQTDG